MRRRKVKQRPTRERLEPIERAMTLSALARMTEAVFQKREEQDSPDRERRLIAEALRRRAEWGQQQDKNTKGVN